MKNRRESFFLFFLAGFLAIYIMPVHAQTNEEPAAAAQGAVVAEPMTPSAGAVQETTSAGTQAPVLPTAPTTAPVPAPQTSAAGSTEVSGPAAPQASASPAETISEKEQATQAALAAAVQAAAVTPSTPESKGPKNTSAILNISGVIEIMGYKYPVYLYVPNDYKTDRTYSLVIVAPVESVKIKDQVDYMTGLAQRKSFFVLVPHVLWPKPGDTPYELDKWLLKLKEDVVQRYPINKKRIYLVGRNSGAHYAAYLATEHPREFTGAALFGEAWNGPFEQLIKPSSDPIHQIPFYIALKTGSDAQARNQAWFEKLQKKGYVLHLTEYPKEDTLNELEFKSAAYEWLMESSQIWASEVAKRQQGWKGNLKKGVRDFFAV